jgi:chain length determinant protein tyrosine kinase EpsG
MMPTELSIAASEQTEAPDPADTRIGSLLLEAGKITSANAEIVLRMQKELGIRFGEAAQRMGLITDVDIAEVLARQFDYPYLQPGQGKFSPDLVAAYDPFSPQVETLRAIRSQLMLRWFARGHKSLTIVGVSEGDGASLFCANLAVVFSQLGEHTLLVDANLRRPSQHLIFNLPEHQGLSDILAGRADASIIERITPFADLSVLIAGTLPPNPQELLSRTSFAGLAAQLTPRFDVTLYDVAASSCGLDALVLAAHSGAVLIVARKHHTSMSELGALADQITANGAEVVGSVLVDFK